MKPMIFHGIRALAAQLVTVASQCEMGTIPRNLQVHVIWAWAPKTTVCYPPIVSAIHCHVELKDSRDETAAPEAAIQLRDSVKGDDVGLLDTIQILELALGKSSSEVEETLFATFGPKQLDLPLSQDARNDQPEFPEMDRSWDNFE